MKANTSKRHHPNYRMGAWSIPIRYHDLIRKDAADNYGGNMSKVVSEALRRYFHLAEDK